MHDVSEEAGSAPAAAKSKGAPVAAGQEKAKEAATTKAPGDKAPSAVTSSKRKEPSEVGQVELERLALKELKRCQKAEDKEKDKQNRKRPAAAGAGTSSASTQDSKKQKDSGPHGTTAMGLAAAFAKQKTAAKTIN